MTEELVTFETAKLAREKGFDEVCKFVWVEKAGVGPIAGSDIFTVPMHQQPPDMQDLYAKLMKDFPTQNSNLQSENVITRPTQDLLERWLREKWRISVAYDFLTSEVCQGSVIEWTYKIMIGFDGNLITAPLFHATHELAREAALLHALKMLP